MMLHEGGKLVSRSQAKRLLSRFSEFKEVVLDFKGVETIGQAFADQIFRVFITTNPNVEIFPINTTTEVIAMIKHVERRDIQTDLFE